MNRSAQRRQYVKTRILKDAEYNKVRARVLALLEAGGLGPDARLETERELCDRLKVGRRTVRRVLDALEAEGLILRRQGKGTFIAPPDPTGLLAAQLIGKTEPGEVMEARLWIEPALAALCATPEDVARMRLLAERVFEAHDQDTAELWDSALHRLIARTAGKRPLRTSFALLDEIHGTDEWLELRSRRRNMDSLKVNDHQHHRIIDATAAGDAEGAAAEMRAHIQRLITIRERNMARDTGMDPLAPLSAEGDTRTRGPDREAIGTQHRAGITEMTGPEEERDG